MWVTSAEPGWTTRLPALAGGAHVIVLADDVSASIEGRLVGLELRDTLLVLQPGPKVSFAFVLRTPLTLATVADQLNATLTGALNIQTCRLESGRWPPNVLLVHGPSCRLEGQKLVERHGGIKRVESGPRGGGGNVYGALVEVKTPQYGGEEGVEIVGSWTCEASCSAKLLDLSSGERRGASSNGRPTDSRGFTRGGAGTALIEGYNDTGGASRYYPQFSTHEELINWLELLAAPPAVQAA
jgi:hypothetical protein